MAAESDTLTGKIALVTGGSTGIGLATARRFVDEGAYVYITGRRRSALDQAVAEIGRNVRAVTGDIANLDDLDRLYATIGEEKGRLDILVANAGTWAAELKDQGIRVNVLSPGVIETPIIDVQFTTPEAVEAGLTMFRSMIPLGRLGRPEEMASAVYYLASDQSSYTTGFDLVADGGVTEI